MTRIHTLIRWSDCHTTPCVIEPCYDGSDDWCIVGDNDTLDKQRRNHSAYQARHKRQLANAVPRVRRLDGV